MKGRAASTRRPEGARIGPNSRPRTEAVAAVAVERRRTAAMCGESVMGCSWAVRPYTLPSMRLAQVGVGAVLSFVGIVLGSPLGCSQSPSRPSSRESAPTASTAQAIQGGTADGTRASVCGRRLHRQQRGQLRGVLLGHAHPSQPRRDGAALRRSVAEDHRLHREPELRSRQRPDVHHDEQQHAADQLGLARRAVRLAPDRQAHLRQRHRAADPRRRRAGERGEARHPRRAVPDDRLLHASASHAHRDRLRQHGPTGFSAGTRRIRSPIDILCIPGDEIIPCPADFNANEFYSDDGTCEGDSGSSAFDAQSVTDNAPFTFGVLSRGGDNAGDAGQPATLCKGGLYTRLDKFRDLVVQTADAASKNWTLYPKPVPDWTIYVPPPVDAGVDAAPPKKTPRADGVACDVNADCKSNVCADTGAGKACTVACDETVMPTTCQDGYICKSGGLRPGSRRRPSRLPPPPAGPGHDHLRMQPGRGAGLGRQLGRPPRIARNRDRSRPGPRGAPPPRCRPLARFALSALRHWISRRFRRYFRSKPCRLPLPRSSRPAQTRRKRRSQPRSRLRHRRRESETATCFGERSIEARGAELANDRQRARFEAVAPARLRGDAGRGVAEAHHVPGAVPHHRGGHPRVRAALPRSGSASRSRPSRPAS